MNEWDQQFGIVHDCLRSCIYGDFLARKQVKDGAWPSIMDMCYGDAVMSWNKIFGQRSQNTHWSKFVEKISIPDDDKLKPFNKNMITDYIKITVAEWEEFHKKIVDVRNIRIAHLNVSRSLHEIPNITWVLHSSYIYREWLIQALHMGNRLGYEIKITDEKTKQVITEFKNQISNAYSGI